MTANTPPPPAAVASPLPFKLPAYCYADAQPYVVRGADGHRLCEAISRNVANAIVAALNALSAPPVLPASYALLRNVATELYMRGRWTCSGISNVEQARLWERLRDALDLPPGTATEVGVGSHYKRPEIDHTYNPLKDATAPTPPPVLPGMSLSDEERALLVDLQRPGPGYNLNDYQRELLRQLSARLPATSDETRDVWPPNDLVREIRDGYDKGSALWAALDELLHARLSGLGGVK